MAPIPGPWHEQRNSPLIAFVLTIACLRANQSYCSHDRLQSILAQALNRIAACLILTLYEAAQLTQSAGLLSL